MLSITSERKTTQQPLQLRVLWSSIVTEMLCYYQPGQNEQIHLCRWAMNEQSALQAAAWRNNSIQVATMLPCTQLGQDWADKLSNTTFQTFRLHVKIILKEEVLRLPSPRVYKAGAHTFWQASVFGLFSEKLKFYDAFIPLFGKNSAHTVVKGWLGSCHFKTQFFTSYQCQLSNSVSNKDPSKYTICSIKNLFISCTPSRIKVILSSLFIYLFLAIIIMWWIPGFQ